MDLVITFKNVNNKIDINLNKFTLNESFYNLKSFFKDFNITVEFSGLSARIMDSYSYTIIHVVTIGSTRSRVSSIHININYLEKMGIELSITYGNKEVLLTKALAMISLTNNPIVIEEWTLDNTKFINKDKGIKLNYIG